LGAWYACLEASGIRRIRFHDLRHTYASLLIEQGAHPKYIQEQMGHSSIKVTMDTYGHLFPNRERGWADKLDEATNATPAQPVSGGRETGSQKSTEGLVELAGIEPATFRLPV